MPANLINQLRNEFSDDVIEKLAFYLGETPARTQSALGYAIPGVAGGLFQKAQTPQGADESARVASARWLRRHIVWQPAHSAANGRRTCRPHQKRGSPAVVVAWTAPEQPDGRYCGGQRIGQAVVGLVVGLGRVRRREPDGEGGQRRRRTQRRVCRRPARRAGSVSGGRGANRSRTGSRGVELDPSGGASTRLRAGTDTGARLRA